MFTKTTRSLTMALCCAALALILAFCFAPSMAFAAKSLQAGSQNTSSSTSSSTKVSTLAKAPGKGKIVSKSTCNNLLAAHTNFNWIQVEVKGGVATDLYL